MKSRLIDFAKSILKTLKKPRFFTPLIILMAVFLSYFYAPFFIADFFYYPVITLCSLSIIIQLIGHTKFFSKIFGQIKWDQPSWANKGSEDNDSQKQKRVITSLRENIKKHPKVFYSILTTIILVSAGSIWWATRPEPVPPPTANASLGSPDITRHIIRNDKLEKSISNAYIYFTESVAPLKDVGKKVTKGINIRPSINGQWVWSKENRLTFTPTEDWTPGEKYRIELSEELTSGTYVINQNQFDFTIDPLKLSSTDKEFYEDPRDPRIRKAIFTIRYNYPIDPDEFKKLISLEEVEFTKIGKKTTSQSKSIGHQVSFDKTFYTAYIHSDQVNIPKHEGEVRLYIKDGVINKFGGPQTASETKINVRIPGMFNYFNVQSSNLNIIDNQKGIPEHIGVLTFSTGVAPSDVKNAIEIYELPYKDEKNKRVINWRSDKRKISKLDISTLPKIPFEVLPSAQTYPKSHMFKISPTVNRYYLIKVKKGLKSASEFELATDADYVEYAETFPKKVKLLHDGAILSMRGEKKLHIYSINVKKLKVTIGQVLSDQIQHLLTQSYGEFDKPTFQNRYNFSEKNLAHFERFDIDVTDHSSTTPSYNTIDFGKYLQRSIKGKDTKGVFFVQVDPHNGASSDKRLILLSDLGVMVKKDIFGNHDIFVQSLNSGEPTSGAEVEIIGSNGIPLVADKTDSRGHSFIPKIHKEDRFAPSPKGILVKKGNDLAYMRYNDYNLELSYSRFAVGGRSNARGKDAISAYLFSDRGIYRPGEEARIGIIAKSSNWAEDLAGIPVDVEVENARGKTIVKESRSLRKNGFDDLVFNLNRSAPTGSYTANIYNFFNNNRKKSRRLIGSVTFKVEEFLPDRLKINTDLSKLKSQGWVTPEDIKGTVNLQNLFGIPASDHRILAKMKVEPVYLYFQKHKDFRFDNPTKNLSQYSENLGESKTDDKGNAEFKISLDKFAKKVFRLKFLAEGFEKEGGRSVTAQISTLVSPYPYLVGVKAIGDYNYIKRQEEKIIHFVAVDSDLNSMIPNDLDISLYEYKYVNVLTKRPNGTYGYESILKEELISKKPLQLQKTSTPFTIDTDKAGEFKLKVTRKDGTELSSFGYTVIGPRNLARTLGKHAELQVKLNKTDYGSGERIEMEIKAPYVGAGLITIERDKVYEYKWFRQNKKTTVQTIDLPNNLEGNAYVNITLLRDVDSPEIYTSPLSYGVFPFTISKDTRRENIAVDVKGVIKPGQNLDIKYKTNQDSEIILFAINEGILQFAKYKNPQPLDYFFVKRALETKTYQLLDLLLPEHSIVKDLLAPGGGDGAMSEHLNPFNRKLKKPVAYWSGILKSSAEEKTWSVPIPGHFNGTMRVLAVAVGKRTLGSLAQKMFVRADIILTPNVLTFASPGDTFEIPVIVMNNIEKSGRQTPIDIQLDVSKHLKINGEKRVNLKVDERKDNKHIYNIKAQSHLGSASLNFTGTSSEYKNSIEETLSLRPSSPFHTSLKLGSVKDDEVEIQVQRKLYDEFARREIAVGATPLIYSRTLHNFLAKNPYGCTEQLISKAFPYVIFAGEDAYGFTKKKSVDFLNTTLNMLRARQNDDGGILLYPEYYNSRPFVTLYALHMLLYAKEKGLPVDKLMIKKTSSYIKNHIKSWSSLYEQSYGIYLLTWAEEVTTPFLMHIENDIQNRIQALSKNSKTWGNDVILAYIAASYKLLQDDKKAEELIEYVKMQRQETGSFYSYYSTSTRDTRVLDILSRHFPEEASKVESQTLVNMFRDLDKQINTLSAAYTLMALDSYENYFQSKTEKNFEVWEYLKIEGKDELKKQKIDLNKMEKFQITFSKQTEKLEIVNPNDNFLFYAYNLAGFDIGAPKSVKNGLEVFKEILGQDGKPTTSVKQGEEVTVVVKFRSTKDKSYQDVALVDLLPTGFANVLTDDQYPRGENGYAPHFVDVREDRLIAYGAISKEMQEFRYKIKATNVGSFVFPATLIEDMYHKENKAIGEQKTVTVSK